MQGGDTSAISAHKTKEMYSVITMKILELSKVISYSRKKIKNRLTDARLELATFSAQ